MKISNNHPASACFLIDTADLAHVQGGANMFPPGDGSPHPLPPQRRAPSSGPDGSNPSPRSGTSIQITGTCNPTEATTIEGSFELGSFKGGASYTHVTCSR